MGFNLEIGNLLIKKILLITLRKNLRLKDFDNGRDADFIKLISFITSINNAIQIFYPLKYIKLSNTKCKPWLDNEVRILTKYKNTLFSKHFRRPLQVGLEYRRARNPLNNLLKQKKNLHYQHLFISSQINCRKV